MCPKMNHAELSSRTNDYQSKRVVELGSMNDLWKAACAKVGETIDMYSGLKHRAASQLINEYGYNIHDVQIAGDRARLESVKKYAKVEASARKAILEKKVVQLRKPLHDSARNPENKN